MTAVEPDGEDESEIVTGHVAAAEYIGVKPATWRTYVTRGYAPKPDLPPATVAGHAMPRWFKATLDTWKANRPGQGARRRSS